MKALQKSLTEALDGRVAEMPDGLGDDPVPLVVHVLHHRHHQRHHVQRERPSLQAPSGRPLRVHGRRAAAMEAAPSHGRQSGAV